MKRSQGRRGFRGLQRRSADRVLKRNILIVGEGQATERNYFDGLKREDTIRQRFNITVSKGHGGSAEQVVAEACKRKDQAIREEKDFDETWCVFDVESAGQRKKVLSALKLAKGNGIEVAPSNPTFEVWLLAHFERRSRPFKDKVAVIQYLNKHWQQQYQREYDPADEHLYRRLADRTRQAIDNARAVRESDHEGKLSVLEANSSTEVYRLVSRLVDDGPRSEPQTTG